MYFDGTGDIITVPDNNAFTLGTNNFTLELWLYPNTNGLVNITGQSDVGGGGVTQSVVIYRSASNFIVGYVNSGATSYAITSSDTALLGSWYHVALVRNGNTLALYINGKANGTVSVTGVTVNNATSVFAVGTVGAITTNNYNGYISNLRLVNGTAVYTSAFTPPTAPLTAITNTQLLLNGTNAGIYDSSARAVGETVGNAQVSTAIKKYGSGSMAFDGTGDWLLVPNSSDLNLGTGDFTIECWLNMANTTAARSLIGKGTSTTGWGIYFNASPTLFIFEAGSTLNYSANYSLNAGQWYHLAVVRSGLGNNNLRMYINGFLIYEATVTGDLTTTSSMYVGGSRTGTQPMFGYVDDLRISKFARYTGPFIPPAVAMQKQG